MNDHKEGNERERTNVKMWARIDLKKRQNRSNDQKIGMNKNKCCE